MTAPGIRPIRYDDLAALNAIAKRGFGPWGTALPIGERETAGFTRATGIVASDGNIPGCLLLSAMPRLMPSNDWAICGYSGAVNLGCPALRFPAPAPIGASVQGRSRLASARPHPKGTIIAIDFEARIEHVATPCLTATVEVLYIGGGA